MEGHTEPILKIIVLEPSRMLRAEEEKVPDTAKVITCSLDNTILLWDFEKMEIITKMEAPEHSELSCMTFLQNCCLVATGHEDGAIRLWNMEINSSVLLKCNESQRHKNTISCIHSTIWKDSEFLLCGSYDGKISVWEISEKKATGGGNQSSSTIYPQLRHLIDNTKVPKENSQMFDGDEVLVLNVYITNDGQEGYILVGGNNVKIQIYSIRTGLLHQEVNQMVGHTDSVTCMVLEGNLLFTGSDDGTIMQWNMNGFF